MSDRFKFRGMTLGGEWVYGNLAIINKKIKPYRITIDEGYYISNKVGMPFAYPVRPETIGQCTGLKDKNGNLIYEGDIIKCGNGPLNTATVEYANGENFIDGIHPFNLYHDCGDECHCQLRDYPEYACEIIGNIHEQAKQKDNK